MSLMCLLGLHRPSLISVSRRNGRYSALCRSCARPLERGEGSRWTACEPLDTGARSAG